MSLLPGWDSLDDVSYWHNAFNIAGIVVLALLVGMETVAQIYGFRESALTRIAEAARNAEKKKKEDDAEARRKTEVQALEKQVSEADKKVAGLQAQNVARRLSDDDKASLIRDLSHSPGQKVQIVCLINSWNCTDYAKDFLYVFKQAKWDVPDTIGNAIAMGRDVAGVEIAVNPAVVSNPQAVPGDFGDSINYLALALTRLGQMRVPTILPDDRVQYSAIVVRIGRIPPPK